MGSSTWKLQTQGLPQRSSLSPMLYNLFTNDFKLEFHKFIKMGCFADDTAFWTIPTPEKYLKQKILQLELNRFCEWSKYWKMSINPQKCSFINIHKTNSFCPNFTYHIDQNPLEEVSSCKYLGLWIDSTLSLKTHISKIKDRLEHHLYHLFFLQNSGLHLYPKTILQIYKSKSRPSIEYASPFYFHKDTNNTIQSLQNRFIRLAYPCKKSTPMHTLQMIAQIQPIQSRVHKLILRHWYRARYSSSFHPLAKTLKLFLKSKHLYKNQRPFDIAHKILSQNKTKISISHNIQPSQGPISALHIYMIFT